MPDTLHNLLQAHAAEIAREYVKAMQESSTLYAATPAEDLAPNVNRSLTLVGSLYRQPADGEAVAYIRSLCEQRVPRGFRLGEVMQAIFLLGNIVVPIIRRELADERLLEAEDQLRLGLNRLAVLWADGYFELQDEMMRAKERAVRQLGAPVVQVWDGILTMPLIGDVDDQRSKQITEELLHKIIESRAAVVLLDITGLLSIDTDVIAQLIRTVAAAELLGTQCWIVGVSPDVAHTIVDLGVDLSSITTYGTLRQGLHHAFRRQGLTVVEQARA